MTQYLEIGGKVLFTFKVSFNLTTLLFKAMGDNHSATSPLQVEVINYCLWYVAKLSASS
jgi:hypothetical protein